MLFGPTGEYPIGPVDPHDQGELIFEVVADHTHHLVLLNFGTEVRWAGFPPKEARQMATQLLRIAQEVENAH